MTMNAKELRAAAEHFKNRSYEESNEGYDEFRKDREAILTHGVDHILATVHADDDEPVTRAKFLELGAEERKTPTGSRYLRLNDMISMWPGYQDRWYINGAPVCDFNPTMGQLRHLLAGLGMEKQV